jgi:hypothetical protein
MSNLSSRNDTNAARASMQCFIQGGGLVKHQHYRVEIWKRLRQMLCIASTAPSLAYELLYSVTIAGIPKHGHVASKEAKCSCSNATRRWMGRDPLRIGKQLAQASQPRGNRMLLSFPTVCASVPQRCGWPLIRRQSYVDDEQKMESCFLFNAAPSVLARRAW